MKLIRIFSILLVLTFSSCTIEPICHLYNNTGKQILIEQFFLNGKSRKYGLKPGAMEPIKDWSWSKIRISIYDKDKKLNKVFNYKQPQKPPNEHWKWKGRWIFARNYFDAQIELTGIIAVLGKHQKYPIRSEFGALTIKPQISKL
jgi:hypothetical protein